MNKKLLFLLSTLILLFGNHFGFTQNLMQNSGFELGSGDNFDNWNKYNGPETLKESKTEFYEGTRSLQVANPTSFGAAESYKVQMVTDDIATVVGSKYTVKFWVKAAKAIDESISFSANTFPNPLTIYSGYYNVTTSWKEISWEFTAADPITRIALYLGKDANTLYLDNGSVTGVAGVVAPTGSCLNLNGSFELGTGNDFTNWTKFNNAAGFSQTTVPAEVRTGTRALKAISKGGNPWDTQLASDEIATVKGGIYTYTFYIKGEKAGTKIKASTNNEDNDFANDHYSADFEVSTEWKKFTTTFTGYDVKTRLILDLGAEVNTYFIDDVCVTTPTTGGGNDTPISGDVPTCRISNQGFEGTNGTTIIDWSYQLNAGITAQSTSTAGEFKSGAKALKVTTLGGNPWEARILAKELDVTPGQKLEFSFYIKAKTAGSQIQFATFPDDANTFYSGKFTVGTNWTLVTANFTPTTSKVRMSIWLNENANTFYIDDVCLANFVADNTPTGNANQTFCGTSTVANLDAKGTDIKWYEASKGGTALATTTVLANSKKYYASQTIAGVESDARLEVTVTITNVVAPTGSAIQTVTANATVASLTPNGTTIKWYEKATGGTALASSTVLINDRKYYASQTTNSCESKERLAVNVIFAAPITIAPSASVAQSFCTSATVSNLVATGTAIKWYASTTGGNALASTTALANNTKYYATQTLNNLESTARAEVTVSIINNNVTGTVVTQTGAATNVSNIAYVSLVKGSTIEKTVSVNSSGNFDLGNICPGGAVKIVLHNNPNGSQTASLPAGYASFTKEGVNNGGITSDGTVNGIIELNVTGSTTIGFEIKPIVLAAEPKNVISVNVFPNPTSNQLMIQAGNTNLEGKTLQIFNGMGKVMLSQKFSSRNNVINISILPDNQTYFVRVGNERAIRFMKVSK